MEREDWFTAIIASTSLQQGMYAWILHNAGLASPVIISTEGLTHWQLAEKLRDTVQEREAVILAKCHSPSALLYPQATFLTFDAHNDGNYVPDIDRSFGDGNFLVFRRSTSYVIGTDIDSDCPRIKHLPSSQAERILQVRRLEELFLSPEVDVFDKKTSIAHGYRPRRKRGMSFDRVLDISKRVAEGRKLRGIYISGYIPEFEPPPFKTARLLVKYMGELTQF